ncbi:lipid A deacylase LpxR family protein [Aquisalinus flavus]|uniref:Membrane protein n=1 Tax=Aquisalinus flavus TaxID=1526572 RepID=A0A8J2V5Q5_9PROT|nr:lipid A deacylase LpxR family protein [Aquisalinus flavus]MBD0427926.1 lipid A deacylase LpxR family protein [Aquisalinus flavus]UNE47683.1 lipid A deacylase LpxR family protein [Aquisalinus flavus]GGD04993.1 membrane protein [Aquisalinus flavus]
MNRTVLKTTASAGILAAMMALGIGAAQAGEGGGTYTLVHENDWMFNQDRDYSSGIRLDYVSGESAVGDGWTGRLATQFLGADSGSRVRTGISLNHMMFVPNDTATAGVPEGQHPYAGYLGGEYSVFEQRGNTLERLAISVGIIGPEAQAEQLQDAFHEIFDDNEAQGWDSQLGTEPAVAVSYDRMQKILMVEGPMGFGADVIAQGGGTLGNTLVQATGGGYVRLGKDLGDDFLPARMFPYSGAGFWDNDSILSAYLFAGMQARLVARNVFLDGSSFEDSPNVDKEPFVGDFFIGAAAQLAFTQVSFTYQQRGKEYETQMTPQKIGSIALSVNF